jgi:hypothetical protein
MNHDTERKQVYFFIMALPAIKFKCCTNPSKTQVCTQSYRRVQ